MALCMGPGEILLQLVHPAVHLPLVEMVVLAIRVAQLEQLVLLEPAVGFAKPAARTWPLSCNIVSDIQKWCILNPEPIAVNSNSDCETANYIHKVLTFSFRLHADTRSATEVPQVWKHS